MKAIIVLVACGLLVVLGCGGESETESAQQADTESTTAAEEKTDGGAAGGTEQKTNNGSAGKNAGPASGGTTITVGDSEFGRMLFGSNDQAIYIFQNDSNGEPVCYDECAEAWPPVFTDGTPRADKGVEESLLGTVERRDGRLQVTYAGQPLYFYANEAPGEVRCHNVKLNGGLWWAVGPDGERLP